MKQLQINVQQVQGILNGQLNLMFLQKNEFLFWKQFFVLLLCVVLGRVPVLVKTDSRFFSHHNSITDDR